jgi:hypothetical protein
VTERPSLDTQALRWASLQVPSWHPYDVRYAARWLSVAPTDIGTSEWGCYCGFEFFRVTGPHAGLYVLDNDYCERLSKPCELCDETGRVIDERHGGQSIRWVCCSCPSGHGKPGEWS